MKRFAAFFLSLLFLSSLLGASTPEITETGDVVVLKNSEIRLEFNLTTGTYDIYDQATNLPAIANASLKINKWASNTENIERSWTQRKVSDSLGHGLALDLSFKTSAAPELLFSFMLYEAASFFSVTGGIRNTTEEIVRVKDIHVLTDAAIYQDYDVSKDFAMIDGFSGGEPLEYGERFYSPLTRANALKSRNNIFFTFSEGGERRQLVMGGLSYHDFEKFATIAQPRRIELAAGKDGVNSLLCYLDLPNERSDRRKKGEESIKLVKGDANRIWENHEFRCPEMASAVKEHCHIIIEANNLKKEQPYLLGFSWWQGHRHGEHTELTQSIFVEFEKNGGTERLPLFKDQVLPRFDGKSKEDVEQVEVPIPAEAVRAGKFYIVVQKGTNSSEEDKHAYLNEVWLRDGRHAALLPSELTPVAEGPRPRRSYTGQLFASDPVGKRVDPGQRYIAPDLFYIDVTGSDPFVALETYAEKIRQAQNIELSIYDFPTVCLWYAADNRYGGKEGEGASNTSFGAVEEAGEIAASGFLNYSRAAVRLVPDSYMPNNQQGWWDDEHWQREDTDRDTTQNGRYVEPYETTEKWGQAVTELGSIPLTYFQTSYRSEDYAKEFPEHMLFDTRYAWKGGPVDTDSEMFTTWQKTWTRNGRVVWGYDFTDPEFLAHMQEVYNNLKIGGVKGLMFDYPASGWAKAGGMEDDYSTTAAAYRTIFRLPHEILGPESYVHERNMERGTDISFGLVASMRTENDTDSLDGATVTRCGLRWYKNRVLVNFDTDSKNLLELEDNRDHVRAVLTMCYVTSGRLLLANSFAQFSPETFWDITRTFPYHTTPKSARPVDAFVSEIPMVYDYEVSPEWHQVTFFNPEKENSKLIGIELSGEQVDGALGLNPEKEYFLYDFWNDRFIGKQKGQSRLEQELRPGEARMIAVRACLHRPQVLSTDRHIMQGYLDLLCVEWDEDKGILNGVSKVVGGDPYKVTLARNGYSPLKIETGNDAVQSNIEPKPGGLVEFTLNATGNTEVEWTVSFIP